MGVGDKVRAPRGHARPGAVELDHRRVRRVDQRIVAQQHENVPAGIRGHVGHAPSPIRQVAPGPLNPIAAVAETNDQLVRPTFLFLHDQEAC